MTIFNKGFSLWLVKFLGLMCEGNFALGNVKANAGKGGSYNAVRIFVGLVFIGLMNFGVLLCLQAEWFQMIMSMELSSFCTVKPIFSHTPQ
ncbi:hypothetical protein [Pseudomonas sp. B21-035]|uniref:hypothetical protein n=1 Tax=Pseudomonas sp. B21-035 TaxID=2895484 RepID=UPI00215F9FC2|nr:hypothetical protein [Pseudomonas sp. B21-035]UVL55505.1 hypothetical protein LOY22_22105 [Pseudomonas sp. B21-035]